MAPARSGPVPPRPPPALRSVSGTPSAGPTGRVPGAPLACSRLPWLSRAGSRGRGARSGTHHSCPSPQGWLGSGKPTPRPGLGLLPAAAGVHGPRPRSGPPQQVRAGGGARAWCASPPPLRPHFRLTELRAGVRGRWGGTPGASSSARAWDACGKRASFADPRGGAARAGRPGARPAWREAAPFVRVTEPCLQAVQLPRRQRRRRRGAGCDHLGRRRPLPRWRGGISLKEAGASLFRGSAAASRRRPAPGGEEGAAAPELGSCSARTPCLAATPSSSSWRVGMPPACAASDGGPGRLGPGLTARTAVFGARRSA